MLFSFNDGRTIYRLSLFEQDDVPSARLSDFITNSAVSDQVMSSPNNNDQNSVAVNAVGKD